MSCSRVKLCNLLVDVLFANKQEWPLFEQCAPNESTRNGMEEWQYGQLCLAALGDTCVWAPIRMSIKEERKARVKVSLPRAHHSNYTKPRRTNKRIDSRQEHFSWLWRN